MPEKHFVVVGGSHGIGLGIVDRLLKREYRVTILSRTADKIPASSLVDHRQVDVTTDPISGSMFPDVVDGLVYCPGSIHLSSIRGIDCDLLVDDFRLNVVGAVKVIQATLAALKKGQAPAIVLLSSVAVQQGMPMHASVAATKGAVEGLTRSLAAELAPQIRVNCVAPSLTDTPLADRFLNSSDKRMAMDKRHPLHRVGSVQDIAAAVDFLLNSDAAWITGQVIGVDGGLSTLRV